MQNFAAFSILSGALVVLGWSFITQPLPQDNQKAYDNCIQLHPERYCRFEHMPSTLER